MYQDMFNIDTILILRGTLIKGLIKLVNIHVNYTFCNPAYIGYTNMSNDNW
jgi:hypothetical protein